MTEILLPRISIIYLPSSSRRPLIGHVPVSTIVLDLITGGKFSLSTPRHTASTPRWTPTSLRSSRANDWCTPSPNPCLPEIKTVVGVVTFTDVDGKTEVGFDVTMQTSDQIRELSESGCAKSFDRLAA